jgi:hypothetical protein
MEAIMKKMIISIALVAGLMSASTNVEAGIFSYFGKQARQARADKAQALKKANDDYKTAFKNTLKQVNEKQCTSTYKNPNLKKCVNINIAKKQESVQNAETTLVAAYMAQNIILSEKTNTEQKASSSNSTAELKLNKAGLKLFEKLEKEAVSELWAESHPKRTRLIKIGKFTIKTAFALAVLGAASIIGANRYGYADFATPYIKACTEICKSKYAYATQKLQNGFNWLAQHMNKN